MKNPGIKIFYLLLLILICRNSTAQIQSGESFYIGFGTGISSYLGGYFGNAYSLKVLSDYSDDYYYNDYNSYNNYNNYYDNTTIWSPIQFDITAGFPLSDNLSAEFTSTFLFAFDGRIDPEFESGTTANNDYLDRNGNSQLYAVPLSATLKYQSTDSYGSGFFFKFGPAFQYTSEEYDRYREYYDYGTYYSYSDFFYLYTVSESRWLPGFTVSTGVQFALSGNVSSFTELAYSYFKINGDNQTALALDRAIEAQLFSLNTKIFFNF